MNSKITSLLVSDYRLCRLLGFKKFCLHFSQKISAFNYCNISLNKPKFLSSFTSGSEMSACTKDENVFQGKEDRYKGITVFSEQESCDIAEFPEKLKKSLIQWRNSEKRGVWFKVHLDQCVWVPILVQNGFKYHHAKENYVMLYLWLPSNESNNIPNYAHTMVGVGAVVVNERDQILVVREKYFYKLPLWKLPGGYVEPGENLVDAAIREVAEETGIDAKFESVLTLTHRHYGMFACSDIYVVVNLKALSDDIQKCEREIAECQWMDIEEYLNHPNTHSLNRFFVQKFLHHKKHNIKIDCHHGVHELLQKPYTVYSMVKVGEDEDIPQNRPFSLFSGETSKSS